MNSREFHVWVRATAEPCFVFMTCAEERLSHLEPGFAFRAEEGYVRIQDYTVTEILQ